MPMTKNQKAESLEVISASLEKANTIYLTDYAGLTVKQSNDLRRRFRDAGIEYRVLKNTLVRIAMERKGGYDDILPHLNGPTALAFSDEPSRPARVLKDFLKAANLEKPEVKAAYVDGAVYGGGSLDALAKLKSKTEILGDVVGLLLSPMTNVVSALQAQGGAIAGCLQTLAEREG